MGVLTCAELRRPLVPSVDAVVDGVTDQVFVDADGSGVADEPAGTAVDRPVLVGRHHHAEPVARSAPGVRLVLEF